MPSELTVTIEQTEDGKPVEKSTFAFYYDDLTDAALHNLSIHRALLNNSSELLALQADDGDRPGRNLSAAELAEIGVA